MSNEPTKRLLAPPEPAAGQPAADTDAGRMLAAFERMEGALRERSNTIDLMRHDLAEMAGLIARAWTALDEQGRLGDAGTLLHGLAARVERMTAFAGAAAQTAAPAVEPPAQPTPEEQAFAAALRDDEADRVPTVSDVFAQLGRAGEEDAETVDAPSGRGVTTVKMLEAMLENLAAAMPSATMPSAAPPAQPDAAPQPDEPQAASPEPAPGLPEAVLVMPPSDPVEPEAASPAFEADAIPAAPRPRHPIIPEVELLTNLARMESIPYLEPEIGTAVIFETKAEPAPQPEPEPESEPDLADLDELLFEPLPEPEPDPAAFLLDPPPAPAAEAAQSEPESAPASDAAQAPIAWDLDPPAPAPLAAPAPPIAQAASEPDRIVTHTLAHDVLAPANAPERKAPAESAEQDPLAAVKAMSDVERIALFE